ncbi:class I SAM-dependent methyltransferase [Ottowia sp.]|uniref:class I SAM-dependent methyltransferase n=1 Tax=Ottowia sp. TaxID=1898956 RepID=UPI003A8831D0
MLHDPWLTRWLPLISECATDAPVLEIGCGHGDDTATLTKAGLRVVAFDLSCTAVALAKARVPAAMIECRDVQAPLPHHPKAVEQSLQVCRCITSLGKKRFQSSKEFERHCDPEVCCSVA